MAGRGEFSSVVARAMANGASNPIAEKPTFLAYPCDLRGDILRLADAIRANPQQDVWALEKASGEVTILVGPYGCASATMPIGAIAGTSAEKWVANWGK